MIVIKRDGREVEFDKTKIVNAIKKAFTPEKLDDTAVAKIEAIADSISEMNKTMTVEEIQDIVEKKLMASSYKNEAKEYIIYRNKRTMQREKNSKFMKTIGEKLTASNVQNQNANVDEYSFGGRKGEAASELTKKYALDYCMSDMARNNHIKNMIYIHDLDSYSIGQHNCLTIPFDDLLANGFNTRQVDIRPANSLNTAFQLIAVIFQIQSLQQFGGVSASHIDWTMIPYVRKSFRKHYENGVNYLYENVDTRTSKALHCSVINTPIDSDFYKKEYPRAYEYAFEMTERECQQAVEGMFHNLNSLQSRSGNQLPFSSINFGTCTLPEGRMVTKAILEGSIKGVGKLHRTSIFPCTIFQCMKGVNRQPGDPNYDLFQLAIKSTAKRLYPNYVNVDWSVNVGYDINDPRTYVSTMGLA